MKQKLQVVECNADFPDDTVWDEQGEDIVQTGGLNMATAVADLLRANGAEVSEPQDHLEHGWELAALWQGGEFWLQVTLLDEEEAYIMTRDHSLGLFARLLGKTSPYAAFLEGLHQALSADGRFSNIRWRPWVGSPNVAGALGPTSPYPGPAFD